MHPNLHRMLEGFRVQDVSGQGVVSDGVFLALVRHYSGEVPAVETLLQQFRAPQHLALQHNGATLQGVDYVGFVHHLDRLLSKGDTASSAQQPTHFTSASDAGVRSVQGDVQHTPLAKPQEAFSDITANTIMLHRQRASPGKGAHTSAVSLVASSAAPHEAFSSLEELQARSLYREGGGGGGVGTLPDATDRYSHSSNGSSGDVRPPARLSYGERSGGGGAAFSAALSEQQQRPQRRQREQREDIATQQQQQQRQQQQQQQRRSSPSPRTYLIQRPEVQELLEPEDDHPAASMHGRGGDLSQQQSNVSRSSAGAGYAQMQGEQGADAGVVVSPQQRRPLQERASGLMDTVTEKVHTSERRSRAHAQHAGGLGGGGGVADVRQHHSGGAGGFVSRFSQEDIASLRDTFAAVDRNGDGFVSYESLLEYLQTSRIHITEATYEQILSVVDPQGRGCLGFEQFCVFVEMVMQSGVALDRTETDATLAHTAHPEDAPPARNDSTDNTQLIEVSLIRSTDGHTTAPEEELQHAQQAQQTQQPTQPTQPTQHNTSSPFRIRFAEHPPADPVLFGQLTAQAGLLLQLCNQQDATRNGYVPFSVLASLCSARCRPRISITKHGVAAIITDARNRRHLLEAADPVVDYIDLVSVLMRAENREREEAQQREGSTPGVHDTHEVETTLPALPAETLPLATPPSTPQRSPGGVASGASAPQSVRRKEEEGDSNQVRQEVAERRRRNRLVHTAMVKLLGQWDAARVVTQAVVGAATVVVAGRTIPQGYMKAHDLSRVLAGLYKGNGQDPVRSVVAAALAVGKMPFAGTVRGATPFEAAAQRAAAALLGSGVAQNAQSTLLVDYRFFLSETKLLSPQAMAAVQEKARLGAAGGGGGGTPRQRAASRSRSLTRPKPQTQRSGSLPRRAVSGSRQGTGVAGSPRSRAGSVVGRVRAASGERGRAGKGGGGVPKTVSATLTPPQKQRRQDSAQRTPQAKESGVQGGVQRAEGGSAEDAEYHQYLLAQLQVKQQLQQQRRGGGGGGGRAASGDRGRVHMP